MHCFKEKFIFMFQSVDSFSDNTYPYRHISKNSTANNYTCWYPQCTEQVDVLKHQLTNYLLSWSVSWPLFQSNEISIQFQRLNNVFMYAEVMNMTQCNQDFRDVLTLHMDVYNDMFNVCMPEATKQNQVDIVSNVNALLDEIKRLDADTHQRAINCGSDAECKVNVEKAAEEQFTYKANRCNMLMDWYWSQSSFNNLSRQFDCLRLKTFGMIEDMKKIANTIEDCFAYLIAMQ